jgi:predicted AAA+ superfamily ATPase
VNVGDLEAFERFLRLCAGRTGQLLNLSALAMDGGISHTTARRWLSILEASFVVLLLRPHHRNFNKRLIKSPKLYLLDTGLLCYLLRIRSPDDLWLHTSRGTIFESFVIADLYKNALHQGQEANLYFWRDAAGHEIDLLIETGRDLLPVEIKSGQTLVRDFFSGIAYWRGLTGQSDTPAALVYAGDQAVLRERVIAYSWACL